MACRIDLEIVLQIPHGWYGQIFGRSSVFQRGLSVHPGVIDADYRGSVQLLVENRPAADPVCVEAGERLAQLLILPVPRVDLRRVSPEEIEPTHRGAGRFWEHRALSLTLFKHESYDTQVPPSPAIFRIMPSYAKEPRE